MDSNNDGDYNDTTDTNERINKNTPGFSDYKNSEEINGEIGRAIAVNGDKLLVGAADYTPKDSSKYKSGGVYIVDRQTYQADLSSAAIKSQTEGAITLTATTTDIAGNAATTSGSFTYSLAAPAAPTNLNLATTDDLGTSNSDNITSQTAITINGCAKEDSTITLYDTTTATLNLGTTTTNQTNPDCTAPRHQWLHQTRQPNQRTAPVSYTHLTLPTKKIV